MEDLLVEEDDRMGDELDFRQLGPVDQIDGAWREAEGWRSRGLEGTLRK